MEFGINQCCSDTQRFDFSKMSLPDMKVDWSCPDLWISAATICFNPIFWNVVARWEYRRHGVSRLTGSPRLGCSLLALTILVLGVYRDHRFHLAMAAQPHWHTLQMNAVLWSGYALLGTGSVLVLTSFISLGFYGTFLGDYFGILMDKEVTSFPFNIISNPMYWGSTFNFMGFALLSASPAGLLLTLLVAVVYKVAIAYEGPFTKMIYMQRAQDEQKKS